MRLLALTPLLLLAACGTDPVNETNEIVEVEVEASINSLEPGVDVTAIDAATDRDAGMVGEEDVENEEE
ncbi:hypothetical protein [Sphingomicrobium flavum]|uniref:hypothetical protein n=1 Tax=Sphingomicrobium flavum TaxID=1229164 RepID=UPI0021ADF137|nr:hypothetical protein [Sphingomicrobium flavum]